MQVRLLVEVRRDMQGIGMGADIGQRGLCRLFHHVAKLPGELKALAAGHLGRFDKHHVAAHRGPDQPGHDARRFGALRGFLVLKARGAGDTSPPVPGQSPGLSVRPSANSRVALRHTAAI